LTTQNKKIVFSTIAGTIASTVSGAIIFGLILNPFQATHTIQYENLMKVPENYGLAILAQIPFAIMFIYIFRNWKTKISAATGFTAGAVIGASIGLCFAIMTLAQMNLIDWVVVFTDVIGHALWGGLTALVVAWIHGRED